MCNLIESEIHIMFNNGIGRSRWLGMDETAEKSVHLHAGKLELQFSSGRILNISFNGEKVISEIYFALRDHNWGTVPYRIENLRIDEQKDRFLISFTAVHETDDIRFRWDAKIEGRENSSIVYSFEGTALSDFMRNRIGFCVLHPASCAGMELEVTHTNGETEKGIFPSDISPHQPFLDIKALAHSPQKGVRIKVEFEGDVFEMEDQRNWTDASFKTYCTPLSLPFPVMVRKGDRIKQTVHVTLQTETVALNVRPTDNENMISLFNGGTYNTENFSLGSCITDPLTELQIERIKALKLSHLRYDYHFKASPAHTETIFRQARQLGVKLLLAVFLTERWEKEVDLICNLLDEYEQDIKGIAVFQENAKVIPVALLNKVRKRLSNYKIPVGSGTDAFFTQINRERLPQGSMDFVCYSNNPQVHAFDNDSIMSTVEGQIANLSSCKSIYPGLPVWVTPVTLKMRWNPDATGETIVRKGELPPDSDTRQMSLFTASWFLRSLAACIKGGAAGVSYFELAGCKVLMEEERPKRDFYFPSEPDMLFPVYFAFLAVRDLDKLTVSVRITDDLTALVLQNSHQTRMILANPQGRAVRLRLNDVPNQVKGIMIDENIVPELAREKLILNFDNYMEFYNLNGEIQLEPYSIFIAEI